MRPSRTALRLFAAAALAAGLAAGAARAQVARAIDGCTTIGQPGSYILTRNITAANLEPNEGCIVIAADFVTLDLNGFALMGDGTGQGISDGNISHLGLSLRNGTVANFATGIDLRRVSRCNLQDLRVLNNTSRGAFADGASIISGNIFAKNGFWGFATPPNSMLLSGNISRDNSVTGINLDAPLVSSVSGVSAVVTRNVASGNSIGIQAINSLMTGNAVHGNGSRGIFPGSDFAETNNFAVTNNAVTASGVGIFYDTLPDDGGLVIFNTSRSNTDGNQVGTCTNCTIVHNRF